MSSVFDGNSWVAGPKLPEARHHLGMVSNSSHLYGIGGFYGVKGDAWQIKQSMFRLGRDSENWVEGPSLPSPQAESVYGAIGENIHVVGGKRFDPALQKVTDSDKHYVLVQDKYWEEAAPASVVRNSGPRSVILSVLLFRK